MKLGIKLVLIISAINLVCFGGLTVASLSFSSSAITSLADENAANITSVTAGAVKAYLEVPLDEIRVLAWTLNDLDRVIPVEQRRTVVNSILENFIKESSFIGIWAIYEPNALDGLDAQYANTPGTDGTGRFISYWTKENGVVSFNALTNYANAKYYTQPLKSGKEEIIDPYYETVSGERMMITTASAPIKSGERIIGAIGIDLMLSEVNNMVEAIKPFGDGFSGVFTNTGMIVGHPDPIRLGKNAAETERDMVGDSLGEMMSSITNGTALVRGVKSANGAEMMLVLEPVLLGRTGTTWSAASIIPLSTVMAPVTRMTMVLVIISVVILVVITVIIFIFSHSITAPLKAMENVFVIIGNGDFTPTVKPKGNDEIATIGYSLNGTLEKIRRLILTIKSQASALSEIGSRLATNMNQTAVAVNEITANIQSIKAQVISQSASVTETNATMEQIANNIDKLTGHVGSQTASVSQSSSAIEEMLANINSVTQTLVRNDENVKQLTDASDVGRSSLQDVATDIQEIARESEGLLEINAVMENIASQTNLLSMNAAIEAAHAGEAGKGFAVVADEIRKLAENSGEQSKTIATVLKKISGSITKISKSTGNVLSNFETIDVDVRTVADQEANIRNAMEEQGQGSKQILDAVGQLNTITQQVKTGADEMLNGSKEVLHETKNLEQVTQRITDGVNEMALGADQINIAVTEANEITAKNKDSIDVLVQEVSKFKVQ